MLLNIEQGKIGKSRGSTTESILADGEAEGAESEEHTALGPQPGVQARGVHRQGQVPSLQREIA